MGAFRLSEKLEIQSHKGPYSVIFDESDLSSLSSDVKDDFHFVVDKKVSSLYEKDLKPILKKDSVLILEATEKAKSLDRFPAYVEHFVSKQIRKGNTLIAIGGGIIQDITSFLSAVLLRGLDWKFYPTTLLAQADSCIGSKSSINVGGAKNILGTFTPPTQIRVNTKFLETLGKEDFRSGIGEMLKVHAIDGPASFDKIAKDYEKLQADQRILQNYIQASLRLKKHFIEVDEFDRGARNVMNYGHSFGHALESASDFAIPHGIAVTIGMDMANQLAVKLGRINLKHHERMHPVLAANFRGFTKVHIPIDRFILALSKDKKNVGGLVRLVLPIREARIEIVNLPNDQELQEFCRDYLDALPNQP